MKDKWRLLSEKLNALTARERGIIFATLLVALYMIFQLLVFDPLMASRTALVNQEVDLKKKIDAVRVEAAEVIAASTFDPNKAIRENIEKEREKTRVYQQEIQSITDKLIEPGQMSDVLASLLNKESGLKLTSVKSISAKPVTLGGSIKQVQNSKPQKASAVQANLYQHTLLLEMEGQYDQVNKYLTQVEALPEKVFWKNLAFQVEDYPVGRLSIEVYTLSTSKDLIGVYQ